MSSYKPPYIWYWFDSILLWFQMSSSWTGLLKNYQKSKSNLLSRHTNPLQTKFCSWKDLQICMIDNFSMSDVQLPGILRHCAGHSSSLWSCQRPPLRVTTVPQCVVQQLMGDSVSDWDRGVGSEVLAQIGSANTAPAVKVAGKQLTNCNRCDKKCLTIFMSMITWRSSDRINNCTEAVDQAIDLWEVDCNRCD